MDIETMHLGVKQELDKTSALELPSFEPEEIDFWLNNTILKFVKTRYSGVNPKRQGFEETQKRMDDLRTLIDHYTDDTAGTGNYHSSYGYTFPLPADYLFALQEEANINVEIPTEIVGVTLTRETRVGITECTVDEYRQKVEDPFSEHKLHYETAKPLRLLYNESVELMTDGNYSVDDYHLTYLKMPEVVDISGTDCDLPDHTHDEIVTMTASRMLENIEQPRYRSHMNEVSTME